MNFFTSGSVMLAQGKVTFNGGKGIWRLWEFPIRCWRTALAPVLSSLTARFCFDGLKNGLAGTQGMIVIFAMEPSSWATQTLSPS